MVIETPKTKRTERAVETLAGLLDEIGAAIALVLLAVGGWLAWRPLAFLVPGTVLLWFVLPARTGFIRTDAKPAPTRTIVRN